MQSTDPNNGLFVLGTDPSTGICDPSKKLVLFGRNVVSGCLILLSPSEITASNCDSLRATTIALVRGSLVLDNTTYVGIWGDSDYLNIIDWTPLEEDSLPIVVSLGNK
jgi:hypothetical protein